MNSTASETIPYELEPERYELTAAPACQLGLRSLPMEPNGLKA